MDSGRNATNFLTVLEENKGIIYKVAQSYCKNEENKKDLIQEIIIQLWLAFEQYNPQFKLSTWMYRIALNVSISFYRKENRRSGIVQALPEGLLNLEDLQGSEDQYTEVDQLYRFIKELKEIDRAVIILYLEGNQQQEIAEILGLTATNVSTKVSRIKQELKQKFSTLKSDR